MHRHGTEEPHEHKNADRYAHAHYGSEGLIMSELQMAPPMGAWHFPPRGGKPDPRDGWALFRESVAIVRLVQILGETAATRTERAMVVELFGKASALLARPEVRQALEEAK